MLTRSQVAERLGKSIATVRRLERAGELNPRRGWRGIHEFSEYEVAAIAQRYERGERIAGARGAAVVSPVRRPATHTRTGLRRSEVLDLQRENADLRQRLELARLAFDLLLARGQVEEALEALDTALDLSPGDL